MLHIGLYRISCDESPLHLLQSKINIFGYLNRVLFSSAPSATGLVDFVTRGVYATPCAADDLDLFNLYAAEPVEFHDVKEADRILNSNLDFYLYGHNGVAVQHQQYGRAPLHLTSRASAPENATARAPTRAPISVQLPLQHTIATGHPRPQPQLFPLHGGHYGEPAEVASHFTLNMSQADVINDQYFNDFRPADARAHDDYQLLYGSLSESYFSPLDDDFFKKMSSPAATSAHTTDDTVFATNKKRPYEVSPSPNVDFYDVNTIFNEYLMENSKYNLESQLRRHIKREDADDLQELRRKSRQGLVASAEKKRCDDASDAKYKCHFCTAKFKVKGYLTRHLKKHNLAKAFVCPFYQELSNRECNPSKKNVISGTKCHPTGGFSRRDTYKTHLKALHFIYPPGTKSSERNSIGGNCAGCFLYFENNLRWLEDHIEKGACTKVVNPVAECD